MTTQRKLDAQRNSERFPVPVLVQIVFWLIIAVLITAPLWHSWLEQIKNGGGL